MHGISVMNSVHSCVVYPGGVLCHAEVESLYTCMMCIICKLFVSQLTKRGNVIHTHFFGAGLLGGVAGLSRSYAVGCQDSELILHPGTQVSDSG